MRPNSRLVLPALLLVGLPVGCLEDIYDPSLRGRGRGDGSQYIGEDSPIAPSASTMVLGPTVRQGDPPPPISGGHLAITTDGMTAVVADPDRDAVYVVDLSAKTLDVHAVRTVQLAKYDEPGRVAIDREGRRAYVALRQGGAVVAIDLATANKAWQHAVCPLPRGIAWYPAKSSIIVVCVGGEIVTLPADGSSATTNHRSTNIVTDLRDVIVTSKGRIFVTTFRSPEVLMLDEPSLNLVKPAAAAFRSFSGGPRTLAWKTMAVAPNPGSDSEEPADDDLFMASQVAGEQVVEVPAEYYVPEPELGIGPVTVVSGPDTNIPVPSAVLPVDIAVSPTKIAVVSAANGHANGYPTVLVFDRNPGARGDQRPLNIAGSYRSYPMTGQITSIAFTPDGSKLVGFSREPAQLIVYRGGDDSSFRVTLANTSREDTGHAIFHSNAGRGSACASCHAEGRDDGHAWVSRALGARRTPSLLGTIANTAPYHWNGEASDLSALARMTFTGRMGGRSLEPDQSAALDGWLTKLPGLVASAPRDAAAAERGKGVFESAGARCSTCHAGRALTNNTTVNVGTSGGAYQVPSLVGVGLRAPYLHDGSRASFEALLQEPHGGAALTSAQAADLAIFLKTL